jgi:hypothetical protein
VLKKQRRVAIWSLSIGVAIAGILTGWTRLHTESIEARVAKRMADCKAASVTGSVAITLEEFKRSWEAKKNSGSHWVPDNSECNPDKVRAVFTNEVEQSNTAANNLGLAIIAVFCVPLLWYFLLDRLREISEAIFHRDQH